MVKVKHFRTMTPLHDIDKNESSLIFCLFSMKFKSTLTESFNYN